MGDVVDGGFITRLHVPPEKVLNKAIGQVKTVVIVGWDNDGEFYFASSEPDGAEVNWLLDKAKLDLLRINQDTEIGAIK